MNKPHTLRLRRLAVPAAAALACGATLAQQADQTVTVTGIRRGIEASISVKKNATGIVDVISAEDIGKLPDNTVAESLARLPGVTAQRNKVTGEASEIHVRGMSGNFVGTLFNGREQASNGDSRAVTFDQFPAELLGQLVVYKSPDAALVGQGLAATVDQLTVRPLDFGKRTIAANYRREKLGVGNGVANGEGTGDKYTLSYVDQFADRKLGIALGFTRLEESGGKQLRFNAWGGWTPTVDYNGQQVTVPGGFGADTEQTVLSRDGAMAVIQYKPNKDFESRFDAFWSKGKFVVEKRGLEGPLGGLSAGPYDAGGTLVNATIVNGIAQAGTFTNYRGVVRNHDEAYTADFISWGWNNTLKLGGWKLGADVSQSKAKRVSERFETTAGLPGNVNNPADTISFTGFTGNNFTDVKYTTGLNYADPNIIKLTNVQGWGGALQDGYRALPKVVDEITALRLSGKRDLSFGPVEAVEFGLNYTKRDKDRDVQEGVLLVRGNTTPNSFASANIPNPGVATAGSTGIPIATWSPRGSIGSVYDFVSWNDADIVNKRWHVQEKVTTAYAMGNLGGSVGGLEYTGNLGLQVVGTQQTASGNAVDRTKCNTTTHTCAVGPYSVGESYTDVLPSMNMRLDLGGDRVLRLGLARQMARPVMSDMRATFDFSFNTNEGILKGDGGNPRLKPFRANALDISFEQYFGNKAYFSIAGFYKDLRTYIIRQGVVTDFAPFLNNSTALPPGAPAVGILTTPVNGSGGNIHGVELAASFPFGQFVKPLEGFGFEVNYSDTSSNVSLPAAGFSTSDVGLPNIPLPGLSRKVTNMRLYYEKNGFQVSLAQRKRSAFLGEVADFQDNRQLTFIKGEAIVDLQVGYEIQSGPAKGLSFLLQGKNLTNAEFQRYNATPDNVIERLKYGKTYALAINYKL